MLIFVAERLWPRRGAEWWLGRSPDRIHSRAKTFHKATSTRRAGNPYRFKLAHIPSNITIMITHPLIGETRMVYYINWTRRTCAPNFNAAKIPCGEIFSGKIMYFPVEREIFYGKIYRGENLVIKSNIPYTFPRLDSVQGRGCVIMIVILLGICANLNR